MIKAPLVCLVIFANISSGFIDWDEANAADSRSWNGSNKERWGWWSKDDFEWSRVAKNLFYRAREDNTTDNKIRVMIPQVIHQIWLGGSLPEKYAAWSHSWAVKNPGWQYHLWGDADAAGLKMFNRIAFDKARNLGEKSDIMRLEILNQYGGIYVDTDFECLRPLETLHNRQGFYAALSNVGYFEVSNGIIATVPRHPAIIRAMEYIASPTPVVLPDSRAAHSTWNGMPVIRRSGPGSFTMAVMSYIIETTLNKSWEQAAVHNMVLYPVSVFFPTPNNLPRPPSKDEIRELFLRPETYAIHHWAASWVPTVND